MAEYFGKYRGKVAGTDDPLQLGRLQVEVPTVLGDGRVNWAMPCVPYAGPGVGLIALPPVGGNVWVEFEAGDPDFPVWAGCFWGPHELPAMADPPGVAVLRVGTVSLVAPNPDRGGVVVAPARSGAPVTEVNVSGTGLTVRRAGQAALTVDGEGLDVRMGPMRIQLSVSDGTLTLGQEAAMITASAQAVEIVQGTSKIKVSPDGVVLRSTGSSATVAPMRVELASGAATVALNPVSVNINNGALEVT